ncbi:MAG: esterase-like activity of phytase family protein [Burkholderiales bacterium]
MKTPTLLHAFLATSLLAACGGSDSDTPTLQGVFLDAAVEGLEYVTASNATKALTTATGAFSCRSNETITFSVGGVVLGSAACSSIITPLTLVGTTDVKNNGVLNRALFLQTLDEDLDSFNGMKLTAEVRSALLGRTLDFSAAPATFNAALTSLLAALPARYQSRVVDEDRRTLAKDHLEDTLASKLATPVNETFTQNNGAGSVGVTVTRYGMQAASSFYIPYEGSNAASKAEYANGFLPAYGSGLAFKSKLTDGTLEFWAITDRGPNGDGPKIAKSIVESPSATGNSDSKIFPAPSFVPSLGIITLGKDGAVLKSRLPIKVSSSVNTNGFAIPPGGVGATGEAPLTDALLFEPSKANYSSHGLDPESVVADPERNALWVSDEYGPFILKIDPATGIIQKKYQPGNGASDLPAVLLKRRANRGMEGLALDPTSKKLHGFLQSPLDDGAVGTSNVRDFAKFARWVEFDPTTETTKLYAYPIDGSVYDRSRTGSAKLGDLVALGNGKFVVIEQGLGTNGKVFNWLMLVEIPSNATNIAAVGTELEKNSISTTVSSTPAYSAVVLLKKTLLLDLNKVGWLAEKAEGLALVDDSTLALTNDTDFGMKTNVLDASGATMAGSDITACTVSATGSLSGCVAGASSARVSRNSDLDRSQRLWMLKFNKKLSEFSVPAAP